MDRWIHKIAILLWNVLGYQSAYKSAEVIRQVLDIKMLVVVAILRKIRGSVCEMGNLVGAVASAGKT
ncbi:hypothetical protein ACTHO5_05720 [Cytobacillus praedii]|uniref:hypothetical protein n=1 Tax=Cytobacillus praedii TaxID=1742358 RepID=UPI003F7D08EA